MQRIDRVEQYVRDYFKSDEKAGKGITAEMAASDLGIWRNDASRELNKLVRNGILRKTETYPVYFSLNEQEQEFAHENKGQGDQPFSCIIGSEGSLKHQIQTARAAASYPPYGLNTFIVGESGVGKTMLAEEIWKYRCKLMSDNSIPFISYNCAEHTDNPQLLLSHMFGHVKGAFTGADRDKKGIVEAADGGILFLDEIHRLPKTGQEMLFTVMDKGLLRPLGGIDNKKVHLMIIGATTECLDTTVLDTFKRRMPIVIRIPSLSERTMKERLDLVSLFFREESRKLSLPIYISREAVKCLVGFESKTNIGDLKNEIQICCAKAYLSYIDKGAENQTGIFVTPKELSRGIVVSQKNLTEIDQFVCEYLSEDGMCVSAENVEMFLEKTKRSERVNGDTELRTEANGAEKWGDISLDNWQKSKKIIELIQAEGSLSFDKEAVSAVALWMEQVFSGAQQGVMSEAAFCMSPRTSEEQSFLDSFSGVLKEELDIALTDGEISLLGLLLKKHSNQADSLRTEYVSYGMVLASAEKEMVEIQTRLVNEAFNARLVCPVVLDEETNRDRSADQIAEAITKFKGRKGAVIFINDKKLVSKKKYIQKKTGMSCSFIFKTDLSIITEMAKTLLVATENQTIDTLCGIVNRSDMFGKFMENFIGNNHD